MTTITKEFTKEQLIEQAKKNIEVLRGAVERVPGTSDAAVIHLKLAEITLASLEAEPVAYQYRQWDAENDEWGEWEDCGECAFEWFAEGETRLGEGVQTRKLYAAPPC